MSYVDGEIQKARITLLRLRNLRVLYVLGTIGVAVIAFLISISDPNHLEPPFGGGGSAVSAVA